jgi:hypothetical protein
MMKRVKMLAAAAAIVAMACGSAMATPSTQIWIPSTDAKDFKNIHIDIDNYARFSSKNADSTNVNIYDIGLSAGVLPFENLKLEVGVDFLKQSVEASDNHPIYLNAKLATPEGAFGIKELPAFAVGGYNLSTVSATQQNIVYGLVAKTLPVVGRLSVGGYTSNEDLYGKKDNKGILASLDRSIPEISDKLWLAVDYMGGNNANGALSVGGSWAFSKQISLIVGAVFFNPFQEVKPGGKPTLTTQIDISLP